MLAVIRKVLQELCQLKTHDQLVVGVSGGPDSLALMMLLHELGWSMVIAHLNHQLRPVADEEEAGVRQWAERIGAEFVSQRRDVAAYARQSHWSIEQAARDCRYRFLFEQAERWRAKAVLVAHTADDQVETVLMRLLRGAGSSALRGMKVVTLPNQWSETIPLVRPLLSIWRSQIMDYLSQQGLQPFMDETNRETIYTRNRIRNDLLPYLETYNPSIRKLIWQTSQLLAAEEEVLQTQEELAWQETVLSSTATSVGINLEKFRQLPQAIRRRIIRRAWSALYPDFTELEFSHVETVIQTLLAPRVSRRKISKWLICLRDYEQGYLLKPGVFPSAWEYPQLQKDEVLSLPLSGSLRINKEWVLQTKLICEHLEEVTRQGRMNRFEAWLDFEVCKKGMYVRPPRAGDRFAPLSMEGKTKKLSDLFIDCKIPFWLRRSFPLICNEAEILWVPGYTISHWARITPATRQALHLELVHLRSETENSGGEH